MTEDLFTFQVHLLVLYNAAFQINSAIFLQIVPNIHHCPADPPRNCNVVSCPSVVQELTLTKFQTEKKKVVVSPCKQIQNIFWKAGGKKKKTTTTFHFRVCPPLEVCQLQKKTKTTQHISLKEDSMSTFVPALKQQRKLYIIL